MSKTTAATEAAANTPAAPKPARQRSAKASATPAAKAPAKKPTPTAAKAAKATQPANAPKAPKADTAAAAKPAPEAAAAKPPKQKLVRDSFTIPRSEYQVLDTLKQRLVQLAKPAKKSELLRAGIKLLAALPDEALIGALAAVPAIKTGRPGKSKS